MFWQEEKNIEYVLWDSHVLLSKSKSRLNSQTLNRKIRFLPGPCIGQDSKLFCCHHEQQINQIHVKKHFPQKIRVKKMLLSSSVLHHLTFVKHIVFSYISLNLEIDIRENSLNTTWNLELESYLANPMRFFQNH